MGKKLVIVESPTKARTISKFLGSNYKVESSFGHIRDLPKSKLGVDVEHNFEPTYVVPTTSKKQVATLKKDLKNADEIILATDEDREGEAIAWHLVEALGLKGKPISRIVFHEITKSAIEEALAHPRTIDLRLVDAQQTRRILDRLVGYKLSPVLWQKVRRGLSAGRVQSVAVRLIVERERERLAFKSDEYWTIDALFNKDKKDFEGKLFAIDGKKLKKLDIGNEEQATSIVNDLKGAKFAVSAVEKKKLNKKPPTPLRTSVLQQEANTTLGFSAKQTMTVAQKLYETGRITYMRTDSMNLSQKFLGEAQSFIKSAYGDAYAKGPVRYKTSSKGAQEAHEAIRPTDPFATPDSLKGKLDRNMWRLYDLIWRRTIASQMPAAQLERTSVDIAGAEKYTFRASGSIIVFDGFMKIYRGSKETLLPELKEGDAINCESVTPTQHFTEPPPRYSDATLVKVLEEHGIGRPSTYAPTLSTIIARGYIERDDNKRLYPTDTAMIVNDMLVEHFAQVVDYDFTAQMEQSLDEIAEGKIEWVPMLRAFYGPFSQNIEEKSKTLSRDDVMPDKELGTDPKTGKTVFVKSGRFGPYIQLGEWEEENRKAKKNKPKSTSLPKSLSFDTITLEEALALLELPREVGTYKNEPITVQIGPYGPYLKAGKTNATLPEQYNPLTITDEEAEQVMAQAAEAKKKMAEPIAELGTDPTSGKPILIKNGRFGPYVTDGKTNASIKKSIDPKDVTFDEAVEMLEKKRKRKGKPSYK